MAQWIDYNIKQQKTKKNHSWREKQYKSRDIVAQTQAWGTIMVPTQHQNVNFKVP